MNALVKSVVFFSLAIISCAQAWSFRQNYVIAVPGETLAVEMQAAEELAEHLDLVTGARLDIVKEDAIPDNFQAIYVGQTAFAAGNGIELGALEQEEWVIHELSDGNVILTGGKLRGILYSVYDYLEKRCNILWLDECTKVCPSNPDLGPDSSNLLSYQRKPSFVQRQIYDSLDWQPVSGKFKERNKAFSYSQNSTGMAKLLGGNRPHHTFVDYSHDWPSDKPELFSRNAEGKPLKATSGLGPGQICMTNPEARELTLARLRTFIQKDRQEAEAAGYPPPCIYDISQNDNYDKCTCEACRALAEKEGSYSAPLLDFINYLAREIRQEYPDVMLRTFAYTYTAKPPKTMRAEDNVIIHLAVLGCEMGGEYYTYDTMRALNHPLNEATQALIIEWSEHANHLAWWSYWTLFPCAPDATIRVNAVAQDLQFAAQRGVYQVFTEYENPIWSFFFPLTRFLGYKLMDDAYADAGTLIAQFMDGYYGKSAATMLELLDFYQREQDNFPYRLGEINVTMRSYLTDEYFRTAFALLARAESESADDAVSLSHIRRERAPLIGALLLRWPELQARDEYDHDALVQEFKQLCQESIDYYFPAEDSQGTRKAILGQLDEMLQSINAFSFTGELPVELKDDVKDGKYFIFNARNFNRTANSAEVDDPEAFTGRAMVWATTEAAPVLQVHNWMVNKKLAVVQLDSKTIPRDGKYHWLKLKSLNFEDNARVQTFVPNPSCLCLGFYRYVPAGSLCDLFLSIKYADGKFWMDQAVLKY